MTHVTLRPDEHSATVLLMSNTLLHAALKCESALNGGGRSCPCCTVAGSTKSGRSNRRQIKKAARRREARQWKLEWA